MIKNYKELNVFLFALAAALVLSNVSLNGPAFAQSAASDQIPEVTGTFDEGPGGNLTGEVIDIRKERQSGEKIDSVFSAEFEPLHKLWDPFAEKLREKGLDVSLRYVAMYQHGSDLIPGIKKEVPDAQKNLSGGDFDFVTKWHAYKPGDSWAGYFRVSIEHRHAYTDLPAVAMGPQIGSLWLTMKGWSEYDQMAVTETFWHQGTRKSPFEYRMGRFKNTSIWNGGKYVDGNSGIVGAQYSNTPALDTPSAGWAMDAVYHPVDGSTHIMGGVFQANGDNEDLQPIYSDQLTYALQVGWKPKRSTGQGRYSIFTWHMDETDDTAEANGFALHMEQGFGNWTPFFRYSYGDHDRNDPKSNAIRQSANAGIGYDQIFGRSKDWVAVVASWSEATDKTLRDQYGVEADYSFRLTPHIFMTPHVQWIHKPSRNPSKENILVSGVRAKFEF